MVSVLKEPFLHIPVLCVCEKARLRIVTHFAAGFYQGCEKPDSCAVLPSSNIQGGFSSRPWVRCCGSRAARRERLAGVCPGRVGLCSVRGFPCLWNHCGRSEKCHFTYWLSCFYENPLTVPSLSLHALSPAGSVSVLLSSRTRVPGQLWSLCNVETPDSFWIFTAGPSISMESLLSHTGHLRSPS